MNKIDWSQVGGFPLDLNDLEYAFGGINEALEGIAKAYGTSGYVLQGCVVTDEGGGDFSITAGWVVCDDGEIYFFPGIGSTSLPGGIAAHVFEAVETLEAGQSEVFEDLSNVNVYLRRRVQVVLAAGAGTQSPINVRIEDRIREMLAHEVPGPWHVIGDAGEPTLDNGYTMGAGDDAVMFRKEPGGIVRIKGQLNAASVAGSADAAFILPAGFRPDTTSTGVLVQTTLTSPVSAAVRGAYVLTDGRFIVSLAGAAASVADNFRLSCFPTFYAAP